MPTINFPDFGQALAPFLSQFQAQQGLIQQQLAMQQAREAAAQQRYEALLTAQQTRDADDRARRQQYEDSVRSTIMDLMKQQAPTAESLANSPEARSFQRLQERSGQLMRARQAEAADLRGIGMTERGETGGALASTTAVGERELAERTYGMQAQLMSRELQARRQQIMQALQMGAGMVSDEQRQSMMRELSQTDAALRQTMGLQGGIGNLLGLGQQGGQGFGQLSLGLLGAVNQNQQYYTGLGADIGYKEALLNQTPYQYLFD